MVLTGRILMILGVLVVLAGAVQLFAATAFSIDPHPNPVGNGMLFSLSLIAGGILAGVGLSLAGVNLSPWSRRKGVRP